MCLILVSRISWVTGKYYPISILQSIVEKWNKNLEPTIHNCIRNWYIRLSIGARDVRTYIYAIDDMMSTCRPISTEEKGLSGRH